MTVAAGALVARGGAADVHTFGTGRVIKLFKPQYAFIAATEAERTAGARDPDLEAYR